LNDEDCEYAQLLDGLTTEERESYDLYRDLMRPIVRDVLGAQFIFDLRRLRLTFDDATRLLDQLDVIHRNQPRAAQDDGNGGGKTTARVIQGNDRSGRFDDE
jgi:hypothetical protein